MGEMDTKTIEDFEVVCDQPPTEEKTERKLATIRRVAAVEPIEGADRIVCATVDGWQLVTQKSNDLKVGDLVLYCEVDSWIPTEVAPFLTKNGHFPKEYKGVKGERLKTIKLKGQVSQGLLLPLVRLPSGMWALPQELSKSEFIMHVSEDSDLTEFLGILKWEKAIPADMRGRAKGNFPAYIRKTDQERIQNLTKYFQRWKDQGLEFEVSEKLDGSSMTAYNNDFEIGVCSRNFDLKPDAGNVFWDTATALKLDDKLFYGALGLAIQGELVGTGVQGNKYDLSDRRLYVFDIWDILSQKYLSEGRRMEITSGLQLDHVPTFGIMNLEQFSTVQDVLEFADGTSALNPKALREGLVFKCVQDPNLSFKAISNKWLLKHD